MTQAARPLQEIMADRMELVMEIARLNSEQQRLCHVAGGVEIDIMRHERDLSADGEGADVVRKLDDAVTRDSEIKASMAECQQRLRSIEEQVKSLDCEIERTQLE